MNFICITALFFFHVANGQHRCCVSDTFQAHLHVYGGSINTTSLDGHHLDRVERVRYDYPNRKIAIHQQGGDQRTIQDYNAHKTYVITNGVCTVYPLPGTMLKCVPDNATASGLGYIGKETNKFTAWAFGLPNTDITIDMIFFTENCTPLMEYVKGHMQHDLLQGQMLVFADYQPSIDDMSYFNIPSSCTSAS